MSEQFKQLVRVPNAYTHNPENNKGAYQKAAVWGKDDTDPKLNSYPLYYMDAEGNEQKLTTVDQSGAGKIYYAFVQNGIFTLSKDSNIVIQPYIKTDSTDDPVSFCLYDLDNGKVGNPVNNTFVNSAQYMQGGYLEVQNAKDINKIKSEGLIWEESREYEVNAKAQGSNGAIYNSKLKQSGNNPVDSLGVNWELYSSPQFFNDPASITALDDNQWLVQDQNGVPVNFKHESSDTGDFGTVPDPVSGFWIPKNLNQFDAKSRGFKEGVSNETANNTIFSEMIQESNANGGIIELPKGKFYVGDIQARYSSVAGKKEKGFTSKWGVGNTEIVFNTSNDSTVIDFTETTFWMRLGGFTASVTDAQLGSFFKSTYGCPRSRIEDIRINNFKHGADFYTWVSNISRIVAQDCFTGFTMSGGTSTEIDTLYALDCDYGHIIGCQRESNGTYKYRTSNVYSTYRNLACDGAKKVAYVIGDNRGVNISGGAEATIRNLFQFPALSNRAPLSLFENNMTTFNGFSAASTAPGFSLFTIQREHINTRFVDSTFSTNGPVFDPEQIWSNRVGLRLDNCGFKQSEIPSDAIDVYLNGVATGKTTNWSEGTLTRTDGVFSNRSKFQVKGDQTVTLRASVDVVNSISLAATVKITPTNNAGSISTLPFGTIEIAGASVSSLTPSIAVNKLGNTTAVNVTVIAASGGGFDVSIGFSSSNTSAYEYLFEIDLDTNATIGNNSIPFEVIGLS